MGGGFGCANGGSSSDAMAGEGSIVSPAAAAAAVGGGIRNVTSTAGSATALFYSRSVGGGSGGDAGVRGGRVPLQGNRPILLPKSTMAAHNGRLLVEYQLGKL